MPSLYDQIIDEAEELANNRVPSPDASDHAIIDLISDIVGVRLGYNTTGAMLAVEAYNRQAGILEQLDNLQLV